MTDTVSITVVGAGKRASRVALPSALFDVPTNIPLIHQVVVAQLAAARQGTHATKTRGLVSGGGSKPWRQKGTGRARQGSRRAPQWKGGGTVFGPQPRSYAQRTNKKMIGAALLSALSDRQRDGRLFVIESIIDEEKPSTKKALQTLSGIGDYRSALVVLDRDEDVAWLSLRNAPVVHALAADQLNAHDVVANDAIVFTHAALDSFLARHGAIAEIDDGEEGDEGEATPVVTPAVVEEPDQPVAEEATPQAQPQEEAVEVPAAEIPVKVAKTAEPPAEAEAKPATKPAARSLKTSAAKEAKPAPAADETSKPVKDFGPGSYVGDNPPAGYDIKGNADSMKFHTVGSPYYSRTIAEVWFNSVEAAEAAGFASVHGDDGADEEDKK